MGAESPLVNIPIHAEYSDRIEFLAIFGCIVLIFSLIELVRRNRLKEKYALLWFLTSGVLLALALRRDWLDDFAKLVGVYYPPSALFLLLVFFMLLILVHFSTVISSLLSDKQVLVQQIGLLEARVKVLERGAEQSSLSSVRTSSNED